jgi:hypothetical protein
MPSPTESLPAADWSPIQLHFQPYLRAFWLNASFHGAIICVSYLRMSKVLVDIDS